LINPLWQGHRSNECTSASPGCPFRSNLSRVRKALRVIHTIVLAHRIDCSDIGSYDGSGRDMPSWRIVSPTCSDLFKREQGEHYY